MSPTARYREIADQLKAEIDTWEVGTKLPSEPALIERFGASRGTVRQALAELRDAGVVRMHHGVGVFVAPPRVVQRLDSRERLSKARRKRNESAFLAEAVSHGFTPSFDVRIWFEPAGMYAEILGVADDAELCVRDRVMRADGVPVMLAVSRLPRDITKGTALEQVETGPGGAHARLEELGFELTAHEEIVGACMPEAHEREALNIEHTALLTIQRRTWSHDRIVEVNDMKMAAYGYELRYAWEAS